MASFKFKNTKQFTLIYFIVLAIDIFVKLYCPIIFRYFSKPLLLLLLLAFYYQQKSLNSGKGHLYVYLALGSFLIGDILIINHIDIKFLAAGLFFFSIGKLFFSVKFSHKEDFNVKRLVPFSITLFTYIFLLIGYMYKGFDMFFFAALFSFFFTLLIFQFAFLRKGVFSARSYNYVFYGVLLYLVGESLMAIKTFKEAIPFQDPLIMLVYGTAVYLIVMGILLEKDKTVISDGNTTLF